MWRLHVNKHGELVVGQNAENEEVVAEVAEPADNLVAMVVAVATKTEGQTPLPSEDRDSLDYTSL